VSGTEIAFSVGFSLNHDFEGVINCDLVIALGFDEGVQLDFWVILEAFFDIGFAIVIK
jgi:hypothetical protein